ncbi:MULTISPECIES: PAS domain-containing protein [unclassified Guyparkeria]|uniref:PAS domain-containing protein n=1 Tax=unclassified Guyparkeria TaxID=2626246 RepID=UPI00073359D8|nr:MULTISPECIES: PAS domain-containing protein [unclassified Guyparkeria]KTG16960.1 histidine kinase [Guyparkeria sp. XI15]OAE85994.1 histidine kinase [Guyparkeria sp. WRN-7]
MLDANLLKKAVNASTDGIVIAEQEGSDNILIYANRAFEELTGYPEEEILYQDCRFLQAGDRDQAPLAEVREAIRGGDSTRVVLRNYRKDGSLFWNELSITPVFNDDDHLTYFIGIQRDVTELVRMREENDRLRERVAELEARLAGEKPDHGDA